MKNTFKKVLSTLSVVALVATSGLLHVSAANSPLTVSSTSYSVDTITVNVSAKDFSADNISSWNVATSTGSVIASGTTTEVIEANGSFAVTDSTNLNSLATGNYSVSFVTVDGDYSSAIVSIGGANEVTVSATVVPTLSLTIDSNSLSFGILNAGTVTTAQSSLSNGYIQVGLATNAEGGAVVNLSTSNNGALKDGTKTIPAATSTLSAGTAGVTYETASKSGNSTVANGILNLSSQTPILDTNGAPSNAQTVNVVSKATISTVTPAGNYSDTLTFTATGSF